MSLPVTDTSPAQRDTATRPAGRRGRAVPWLLWMMLKVFLRKGVLRPSTALRLLRYELRSLRNAPRGTTRGEELVRQDGVNRAHRVLDRVVRKAADDASTRDRLLAEALRLRAIAQQLSSTPITGHRGGLHTLVEAKTMANEIAGQIRADENHGSLRHLRVVRWIRTVVWLFTAIVDAPIMFWFASSVFNVDWRAPFSIEVGVSLSFSLLVTGGSAFVLHTIGLGLRDYKSDNRELEWGELPFGARTQLVFAVGLSLFLSASLLVRVYIEAVASGETVLAVVFAVLVASVMLVVNVLVCWTAFRDGSNERDTAEYYTAAARALMETQERNLLEARQFEHEAEALRRRAQRERGVGYGDASVPMRMADEIIDLHRAVHDPDGPEVQATIDPNAHDGPVGYRETDPWPHVDQRALGLVFEHLNNTDVYGVTAEEQAADGDSSEVS